MASTPLTRRTFLQRSSLAAGLAAVPAALRAAPPTAPGRRLNVALIGVGGIGHLAAAGMKDENIVAFCDVDSVRAERTYRTMEEKYPEEWARMKDAPRFTDYRRMFDALGSKIEAVTISTPDHSHFPIAMTALALGKHVHRQKPLTHTVREARLLTEAARAAKVVTQMGNQGHAGEGCRLLKEWVDAGVLGEVRRVHSWTDRPGTARARPYWPYVAAAPDHSRMIPVVPPTLDWNAWLCADLDRPYDPAYLPHDWRGWWDFGTGPLGDVGCHIMDGAYWALGLGAPSAVEAVTAGRSEHGSPPAAVIKMEFPARGGRPPVEYTWSDGGLLPPAPPELEAARALNLEAGTLLYGSKATVLCSFYYESVRIIPEARMRELNPSLPPRSLPRVEGGPFAEWLRAIKGEGPAPGSQFDYSGPLTETVLLGNVALRTGRRIEWDSANLRVTNLPEANRFLAKEYRPGWF